MLIQNTKCLLFNLHELFPAFVYADNIGNLVNSLFGVNILNPVPVAFLFHGFNFVQKHCRIFDTVFLQHLVAFSILYLTENVQIF